MFVAKIEGGNVKIFDPKTSTLKKTFSCGDYRGVHS